MNLKVIAFDADDTLFVNEPYFLETEEKFCGLMEDYLSHQGISQELFKVEIANLKIYGYGIKAYILSMIEAAMKISNNTIPIEVIEKIRSAEALMPNKHNIVFLHSSTEELSISEKCKQLDVLHRIIKPLKISNLTSILQYNIRIVIKLTLNSRI